MALPELSYICIPSFRSVAPRVFLVIIPFFSSLFYHCGNHFLDFLAHVLSWVKPRTMPSFRGI